MDSCKRVIRVKTMTDDKIENFNEHRLRKAVDDLKTDEDILEFARWVNKNVTKEFTIETEVPKEKDHIRDILKTMPDKNGYYSPPYK
jgi:hypothetical protein